MSKPITEQRADHYGLEPQAMDEVWDKVSDGPREAEIERSKAISAKRQADALERIAGALDGEGPAWINGLSNIAYEAGRAFEAGRRQ